MKFLLFMLLFSLAGTLRADVFTLWPVRRGGGNAAPGSILDGSFKQVLHKETVLVNGIRLEMEISQTEVPFDTLLAQLKRSLGKDDFRAEGSTIRIGYPVSGNRVERWLLVREKGNKTTLFHMVSPQKLPPPAGWPKELPPLPVGATVTQTMEFPKRGGIQGTFQNAQGHKRDILRQMGRYLESDGWIAAGAEATLTHTSGGDLFIRTRKGKELLWIAIGDDGSGSCYYRKSK